MTATPHPSLVAHLDAELGHSSYTSTGNVVTVNTNANVSMMKLRNLLDVAHLIAHDCSMVAGVVTVKPRIGS